MGWVPRAERRCTDSDGSSQPRGDRPQSTSTASAQQQPGGQSGQSGQQGSTRIERTSFPNAFRSHSRGRIVASTAVDTLTHPSTPVNMRLVRKEIAQLEDCCTPLGPAQLSGEEADRMASALRVLADPARLQIVSLLAGTEEACVCELTPALGVSQPTVSHHLRVLSEAGLLEREQRGRWAYYRLRPEPLRLVADALAPRATVPARS